jgi:hypothetical protein
LPPRIFPASIFAAVSLSYAYKPWQPYTLNTPLELAEADSSNFKHRDYDPLYRTSSANAIPEKLPKRKIIHD